jgi:hypothetical protein
MKKQITAVLTFGLVAMAGQAQTKWTGFKAGATLGSTRYEAVWTDTSYDWFVAGAAQGCASLESGPLGLGLTRHGDESKSKDSSDLFFHSFS